MSVQSDCEMMSVDIMEAYAEKYHLTGDETIKLFHKYQVYEKIMIQHEYLHQVSTCLLYTSYCRLWHLYSLFGLCHF